ncbi:MAG: extracellular solute-binding protein [Clostridia bacterium]|nr:extracellular solute-binding protein [Clostridia bacterium]
MTGRKIRNACLALALVLLTALATAGCAESYDGITLYVMDGNAYALDLYEDMINAFVEAHPGLIVEVQHAADNSDVILATRISAGDIPDIFAAGAGLSIEKYREYVYQWQDDADVLALFQDSAIESVRKPDGAILGLPDTFATPGFLYNVDVFERAGIETPPKTLAELEEACEKIAAIGVTPFALATASGWPLSQMAEGFTIDRTLGAAGTAAKINAGEATVTEASGFYPNLFKILDLAVQYGPKAPLEIDWEIAENMLANGEAAMIHIGDWCYQVLIDANPDCNISMMATPLSDDPNDAVAIASVAWEFMVNKDSEHLELAKELCVWILASEPGCHFFINGQGVPCAKNDLPPANMLQEGSAALQKEGVVIDRLMNYLPASGGFGTVQYEALQGYMLGILSAEDAMQAIDEAWIVE